MATRITLHRSETSNWALALTASLGMLMGTASSAVAQQTLYVGASGGDAVVVDLGAIDGTPAQDAPDTLGTGMPNLSPYHYSGRALKWPEPEKLGAGRSLAPQPAKRAAPAPVKMAEPAPAPTMAPAPMEAEPKEVPAPAPVAPVMVEKVETVEASAATPAMPKKAEVASALPKAEPAPVPAPAANTEQATAAPTALKPVVQPVEQPAKPEMQDAPKAEMPKEVAVTPAPAPAPQVDPTPVVETPKEQVAAIAPEPVKQIAPTAPVARDGVTMILFGVDGEAVPNAQKATLDKIAASYADNTDRIQLKAYAGSESTNNSLARRLSLKRALAVRSYLMDAGIRGKRIDVRALGVANDGGPTDRVEISTLNQ